MSSTVIKFQIPASLAEDLGLRAQYTLGEFRGAVPLDIPGGSGFERILMGDNVGLFNDALSDGIIQTTRLRVGK